MRKTVVGLGVFMLFASLVSGDLGDLAEFQDHLRRLVEPYDADPRPTVMVNPKTGEEIFIVGDRTHCVAVIGPGGICHL